MRGERKREGEGEGEERKKRGEELEKFNQLYVLHSSGWTWREGGHLTDLQDENSDTAGNSSVFM